MKHRLTKSPTCELSHLLSPARFPFQICRFTCLLRFTFTFLVTALFSPCLSAFTSHQQMHFLKGRARKRRRIFSSSSSPSSSSSLCSLGHMAYQIARGSRGRNSRLDLAKSSAFCCCEIWLDIRTNGLIWTTHA